MSRVTSAPKGRWKPASGTATEPEPPQSRTAEGHVAALNLFQHTVLRACAAKPKASSVQGLAAFAHQFHGHLSSAQRLAHLNTKPLAFAVYRNEGGSMDAINLAVERTRGVASRNAKTLEDKLKRRGATGAALVILAKGSAADEMCKGDPVLSDALRKVGHLELAASIPPVLFIIIVPSSWGRPSETSTHHPLLPGSEHATPPLNFGGPQESIRASRGVKEATVRLLLRPCLVKRGLGERLWSRIEELMFEVGPACQDTKGVPHASMQPRVIL